MDYLSYFVLFSKQIKCSRTYKASYNDIIYVSVLIIVINNKTIVSNQIKYHSSCFTFLYSKSDVVYWFYV